MNGIIIDGKVYVADWTTDTFICNNCDLCQICTESANDFCNDYCKVAHDPQNREDYFPYFRYSQSLTDKLNDKLNDK